MWAKIPLFDKTALDSVCEFVSSLICFFAAGLKESCVLYISALPLESFLVAPMSSV